MMVKLTEDHDLFGKCNIIWNKVSVDIKTNLIANLLQIFFFFENQNRIFHDKEIPKVGFNHSCSNQLGFCSQER